MGKIQEDKTDSEELIDRLKKISCSDIEFLSAMSNVDYVSYIDHESKFIHLHHDLCSDRFDLICLYYFSITYGANSKEFNPLREKYAKIKIFPQRKDGNKYFNAKLTSNCNDVVEYESPSLYGLLGDIETRNTTNGKIPELRARDNIIKILENAIFAQFNYSLIKIRKYERRYFLSKRDAVSLVEQEKMGLLSGYFVDRNSGNIFHEDNAFHLENAPKSTLCSGMIKMLDEKRGEN